MLSSALFTYRRRVVVKDTNNEDVEVYNDNYLNPLNVISFYWQLNEKNVRVLSVFLANQYTITFPESIGQRFVEHMEAFLRSTIRLSTQTHPYPNPLQRKIRQPIAAEVVEDEVTSTPSAKWED